MLLDERDTIIALKNGDEAAFRLIFDQNFRKLYAFCFRMLKNKEQAEEVVQDALLNVWLNRNRLDIDLPIAPYLYTIVRRLTLNALRQVATTQKMIDQLWLNLEKVSNITEESILLTDLQRFTESSLEILPPQQQLVFKMSRFEGLNYDEIAEKLNISRNTVKNHLIAALKTLRMHFNLSDMACFFLLSSIFLRK